MQILSSSVKGSLDVPRYKHTPLCTGQIRDEEKRKLCQPTKQTFPAVHRTCFDPRKSHIVVGALGGMGMETVHWMVLRGAKKLILTSR